VIFELIITGTSERGIKARLGDAEMWLPRSGPGIEWTGDVEIDGMAYLRAPKWLITKHRPLASFQYQRSLALYHPGGEIDPEKGRNPLPGSGQAQKGHTMNSIEIAAVGFVGRDAELKTSQAGKPWCRVSIGIGKDDSTQWIGLTLFGDMATDLAPRLKKGTRVYIEGRDLKIDAYTTQSGEQRHALAAIATKVEILGQIGQQRPAQPAEPRGNAYAQATGRVPPAERHRQVDDEIPF
jgi:single-strand DNA-binding protein